MKTKNQKLQNLRTEFLFGLNNIFTFIKLLFNSYRSRFQGPYFNFIQPLLILVIYGGITAFLAEKANYQNNSLDAQITGLVPGIMCTTVFAIGASSLSFNILMFKESVIIKRIAVTPITKSQFIAGSCTFSFILSVVSMSWIWMWAEILFHQQLSSSFAHLNAAGFSQTSIGWLWFFLGLFMTIFISGLIGMFIAAICNTTQKGLGISQLIFFFTSIFAGGTISPVLLNNSAPLRWISFFSLMRYPFQWVREGWFGQNIFNPTDGNFLSTSSYGDVSSFSAYGVPDWFAFILTFCLFGFLIFLVKRLFKWEV